MPAALIRQTIAQWAAPESGRETERHKSRTRNQSGKSTSNNPLTQRHEQLLPKTPLNPLTTSTLLISKEKMGAVRGKNRGVPNRWSGLMAPGGKNRRLEVTCRTRLLRRAGIWEEHCRRWRSGGLSQRPAGDRRWGNRGKKEKKMPVGARWARVGPGINFLFCRKKLR